VEETANETAIETAIEQTNRPEGGAPMKLRLFLAALPIIDMYSGGSLAAPRTLRVRIATSVKSS
jgi:hypothetical protein